MIPAVLRYEWLRLRARRAFLPAALLLVAVLGIALRAGQERARAVRQEVQQAQAEAAERRKTLDTKLAAALAEGKKVKHSDPRSPAYAGGYRGAQVAVKPPAPLALLAVGQSDLYPAHLPISTDHRPDLAGDPGFENPDHSLAGPFDPAFVVIYLLPLAVLALTFDLLSGEREAGTLCLVCSQPQTLAGFAASRLALRAGVLLAVVLLAAVPAMVMAGVQASAAALQGLALAGLVIAAYLGFWFAAAFAVNAAGFSSPTNAMALAGTWLAVVVVIPATLNTYVQARFPPPSRLELVRAQREAAAHAEEDAAEDLAEFYQDHPDLAEGGQAKVDDYTLKKLVAADATEAAVAPLRAKFRARLAAQQEAVDRWRFLSPAVVAHEALAEIAGTSTGAYLRFEDRARAADEAWDGFFRPRIFGKVLLTPEDYKAFPSYDASPEPLSSSLARLLVDLLALLVPAILLVLWGRGALGRYPIRG